MLCLLIDRRDRRSLAEAELGAELVFSLRVSLQKSYSQSLANSIILKRLSDGLAGTLLYALFALSKTCVMPAGRGLRFPGNRRVRKLA